MCVSTTQSRRASAVNTGCDFVSSSHRMHCNDSSSRDGELWYEHGVSQYTRMCVCVFEMVVKWLGKNDRRQNNHHRKTDTSFLSTVRTSQSYVCRHSQRHTMQQLIIFVRWYLIAMSHIIGQENVDDNVKLRYTAYRVDCQAKLHIVNGYLLCACCL